MTSYQSGPEVVDVIYRLQLNIFFRIPFMILPYKLYNVPYLSEHDMLAFQQLHVSSSGFRSRSVQFSF